MSHLVLRLELRAQRRLRIQDQELHEQAVVPQDGARGGALAARAHYRGHSQARPTGQGSECADRQREQYRERHCRARTGRAARQA